MIARRVTPVAQVVRADNAGVMTLDGTNTWILRGPGSAASVVVDPGPNDADHLAEVRAAAGEVALVLFTHHHFDHTASHPLVREWAPTRAVSPQWCADAEPLVDGELLSVAGLTLEVLLTPGHTADSLSLLVTDDASLLTGDTILGVGTTVVAHPDGALGPYLESLETIRNLVVSGRVRRFLPGHGPQIEEPLAVVDHYLAHRQDRLDQIRAAVAAGATTPGQVVELVYKDVDRSLWPAAELSVAAHLAYLDL